MMRATQALAIGNVEWWTTITDLNDMIGKHAMDRLSLGASIAVRNGFAPATCSSQDPGTPFTELR
jgi:hypothetical protein